MRRALTSDSHSDKDTLLVRVEDECQAKIQYAHGDRSTASAQQEALPAAKCSAQPNKIQFLDGIRGLAVFMVVAQHAGFSGGKHTGEMGVDVFFVLSAFLLTMAMEKKCRWLLLQKATQRQWLFVMADYFCKRFLRVYPLFIFVAIILKLIPISQTDRYFKIFGINHEYDLLKVLTFAEDSRFHVFWTLPLEIAYYFFIPVLVVIILELRRTWWVVLLGLYGWIVHNGFYTVRKVHTPLSIHFPTFLSGSLAAIVYAKINQFMKAEGLTFSSYQKLLIRTFSYAALGLIVSVCLQGQFFHWIHSNPISKGSGGFPFIGVLVTVFIVLEMLSPSELGGLFEWNFLRYWGKISFSAYLLHSFVIYTEVILSQEDYYDRFLSEFGLTMVISTVSYHLVEYPSLLLVNRISKALTKHGNLLEILPLSPLPLRPRIEHKPERKPDHVA